MEHIILLHKNSKQKTLVGTGAMGIDAIPAVPIWKTCLRQIAFVNELMHGPIDNEIVDCEQNEIYRGDSSYQFLLQVLSGLKSPMIGETEVLGQFKEFLAQHEQHPFMVRERSFFNTLLQDTKLVRDQNLRNLGCHSYGSLSRRLLRDFKSAALIGSGQLAQEILPWLKEIPQLAVLARNGAKASTLMLQRLDLKVGSLTESADFQSDALVVCAPIDNDVLIQLIRSQNSRLVLDLRGETQLSSGQLSELVQYYSLDQFMDEIKEERQQALRKVQDAEEHIRVLVEQRRRKVILRPLGWDDLWC